MIKTYQRERVVNATIYFATNTKFCGKTKLMKLMYFLDFIHFKQTGQTVTGLEYQTWPRGPVPAPLFNELSSMQPDLSEAITVIPHDDFRQIKAKKKFNARYFTPRQLKILENVSFIFKEAKADDMIEATHLKNKPWDTTLRQKGKFQPIDYILAIDGEKDCISKEDAQEIMDEVSEMHEIFGTV